MDEVSHPPPSSDTISHQSKPHACSFVCWWKWIPSPIYFLIILLTQSFLLFPAASQSVPARIASSPDINQTKQNSHHHHHSKLGLSRTQLIVISVSAFVALLVIVVLSVMACFRFFKLSIRRNKNRVVNDVESVIDGEKLDQSGVRRLSWGEVETLTNRFEKVIDSGGFSVVYHGNLPGEGTLPKREAAVGAFKIHNSSDRLNQGFKEELKILLKLDHENIVKLHAYCDDQDRGALVFEFVPNGTLQEKLQVSRTNRSASRLDWSTRVSIVYQLAQALEYIHERCELQIVHGDIKSSNILLDSNHNVKLCDFGSAKMGFSAALTPPHPSRKLLITGSPGYVDPHYLRTGIMSKKNDIYSFGVVVLELLTGKEAFCEETGQMLTGRFLTGSGHVNANSMDPGLNGEFDSEEARVLKEIAAMCVRGSASLRPSASEVLGIMRQNVRGIRH